MRISFIGLLGAGKSRATQALLSRLQQQGFRCDLISTDDVIIRRMRIPQDPIILQFQKTHALEIATEIFQSDSPTATFIQLYGEPRFRDLEEMFIVDAIENATAQTFFDLGGKVPLRKSLATKLKALGVVFVFLNVNADTIESHLSAGNTWQTRGIYKLAEETGGGWKTLASQHRTERVPQYTQVADIMIDADGMTPEEIVAATLEAIKARFDLDFIGQFAASKLLTV